MTRNQDANSRLVYSSGAGGLCPACGKPLKKCSCKQNQSKPPAGDGIVRVSRETKGRKGKGVTLITGTALEGDALKQLGKRLKARCGSGGTVKEGVVEIQGDHRELIAEELRREGYTVKLA
ncbi:MAG: translation initiation factor Sui1, partial [Desulfosalsimonadaceae bacterium]